MTSNWRLRIGNQFTTCSAIAFDKDGTLTDRRALWWGQFRHRYALLNEKHGREFADRWASAVGVEVGHQSIDPVGPLAAASSQQEAVLLASLLYRSERTAWVDCLEQATQLIDGADQRLEPSEFARPLTGVPETLDQLRTARLPMALVTMDSRANTDRAVEHLDLGDTFGCIITPEDVTQPKPAPDMLLLAAARLEVQPAEMVMVGDTISDLQMARAAGAQPVLLVQDLTNAPPVEGALATISSLEEIELSSG